MRAVFSLLLLTGCSSYVASVQEDKYRTDIAFNEMRIEISDLKHALNATQVEVEILEEKLKKQEAFLLNQKPQQGKSELLVQQMAQLEKKFASLQTMQEQAAQDLQQFRTHANETSKAIQGLSQEIQSQNRRFDEISKLKNTLSSLSKEMTRPQEVAAPASATTHRVKSGDNLEKIARQYNTTARELKRFNNLSSDKIAIGQELKIP